MKVYYKNLNSLRFIAASLVVIHHVEQYKWFNGLPHCFDSLVIQLFGKLGVDIFFVLSGFLITSLLVIEKERFQRISIKAFYIRRILRIWPLYFLIAFLSFFVWPHIPALHIIQMPDPYAHFWRNLLLVVFFLPNLQMLLYRAIPYMAQSWSIGVEEQFYLVWPFLMNWTKKREQFKWVIVVLLVLYIALKLTLYLIPLITHRYQRLDGFCFYLTDIFQIDCMMFGALFAIFNLEEKTRKILTHRAVQAAAYVTVLALLATGTVFGYFYWEVYGVLFAVIILNLVNADTSIINLDFKWMNYLGKISYSMYMVHVIVINCVIRFISHNSLVIYPLSFVFTIILSVLSYEFFEKRFLRWKSSYAKVQSGSNPSEGM